MRYFCIPCALLALILLSLATPPQAQDSYNRRPRYTDPGAFEQVGKRMLEFHGDLYFTASDYNTGGGLFRTDGTPEGTVLVKSMTTPRLLAVVGDTLFFQAEYNELWKSDGTPDGTVLIKKLSRYVRRFLFPVAFKGMLYFAGADDEHGEEVWRSDGTPEGTQMVKDIASGADPGYPSQLTVYNNELYFEAVSSQYTFWLWKSDGTTKGTQATGGPSFGMRYHGGYSPLIPFKGQLYFASDSGELYRTDGVTKESIRDFSSDEKSAHISQLTPIGDRLYFVVYGNRSGTELWQFDATTNGATLLKTVHPGQIAHPPLCPLGDVLMFSCYEDGIGWVLWKTDGTTPGTMRAAKVESDAETMRENHGTGTEAGQNYAELNGRLLFNATDDMHGSELWSTDGTETGTVLVKDIRNGERGSSPQHFTRFGDAVYFLADDGIRGQELWRTDGTPQGTQLLLNINVGRASSDPRKFVGLGNSVLFEADDGVHGRELWRSDGTADGTYLVKDLYEGESDSVPYMIGEINGRCLLWAMREDRVNRLWITDGTPGNTVSVDGPPPSANVSMGDDSRVASIDERILVFLMRDSSQYELWRSDGTPEGTFSLASFPDGDRSQKPGDLQPVGKRVCFRLGAQLWGTDGSRDGTILLKDFHPDGPGWGVGRFVVAPGKLFFPADDRVHGNELWVTDGTTEGTRLVRDIFPPYKR